MQIKDLFESDVTRDIPPVVYFHEQDAEKVAAEVGEYIITGGFEDNHPNHRRVPDGIHEQYVRLLTSISEEMARKVMRLELLGSSLDISRGGVLVRCGKDVIAGARCEVYFPGDIRSISKVT